MTVKVANTVVGVCRLSQAAAVKTSQGEKLSNEGQLGGGDILVLPGVRGQNGPISWSP